MCYQCYIEILSHVLVEKLLQFLIDIVDADLLEAVVVEDLKAGDVEDTDVGDLLHGGVAQGLVTLVHSNPEGTLVDGTGNSRHRVGSILAGGALLHLRVAQLQKRIPYLIVFTFF